MSWNNAAVTNAGVALLNESLAGHILTITSAVGGAGMLEDQELASAVDVVDQKQTFSLMGLEDLEQGKQVGVQISNKGVSESYILHQIGVKAKLEYEEEETLLFLLQDDRGVEIPAEAENPDFLFEVYATIAISNKANITINVNPHVIASVEYVDRTFVKLKTDLLHKADIYHNLSELGLSGGVTVSQVCEAMQDGWIFSAWNDTEVSPCISDVPDRYTLITIYRAAEPYVVCRAVRILDGQEYVGTWNPDRDQNWSGWMPQATATPPQEYNLPLAEGFSTWGIGCKYYKTQENIVVIHINVETDHVQTAGEEIVIGSLPVGFRPGGHVLSAAYCNHYNDLTAKPGYIFCDYTGNVIVRADSAWNMAHGTTIFLAPEGV